MKEYKNNYKNYVQRNFIFFFTEAVGMAKEEDFTWDDDLMTRSLQRQNSHLAKLGTRSDLVIRQR